MPRDEDFEPHLGRMRDQGGTAGKIRSFSSEVVAVGRKSGLGAIDLGPRRRVRAFGRGRSVRSGGAGRNVVVKARIIRHRGDRFRAASVRTHLYYLRRGGTGRGGEPGEAFDRDGVADHDAFAERAEPDRHHFRFIVSPEDADRLADLRETTRDLMSQLERDLGSKLDWVAVDHWNTDNPHVHILVRGVADDGRDLVISRDYMSRGLRERAKEIVTRELGPRTELEIAASADREVQAERWTSHDHKLRGRVHGQGLIDMRPGREDDPQARRRLIGRLQVLERYGLSEETAPGRWRIAADLEPRLRELAVRGDIIKSLHQAMGQAQRDPSQLVIQGDDLAAPVIGRVAARGLHDELVGQAYVIVDGVDGRLHHFRFRDIAASGDTPVGGIVEVRPQIDQDGSPIAPALVHRSDLAIGRQVTADGATWLDRQLVVKDPALLASHGFGAEVATAMEQRREHLVANGHGRLRDGRFEPAGNLLGSLRRAELDRVKGSLATSGGQIKESGEGDLVSGVYARRMDLASGRFAMIDDGLGFQLVPWTRALDAKLGQEVTGTITKAGVDWSLGKKRGLGL
jgi:type IV secretory pathway VirD2 relaxase